MGSSLKYNVAGFKEGYAMPFAVEDAEHGGSDLSSLQIVRELEQRGSLGELTNIQINERGTSFFHYERGFVAVSKKDRKE